MHVNNLTNNWYNIHNIQQSTDYSLIVSTLKAQAMKLLICWDIGADGAGATEHVIGRAQLNPGILLGLVLQSYQSVTPELTGRRGTYMDIWFLL